MPLRARVLASQAAILDQLYAQIRAGQGTPQVFAQMRHVERQLRSLGAH